MTIEIGQKAPDLELKGDHGETVKLSDYKGKIGRASCRERV